MDIEFSDCGKPLTESDVAAFEAEFGIVLPTEYRQFLLMHNGGVPVPLVESLENRA